MDKNLVHGTYNTESVQTYLVIMVQIDDISKTELDLLKQVLELKSKTKLKINLNAVFIVGYGMLYFYCYKVVHSVCSC